MSRRPRRISRATVFFAVLSAVLAIALYLKSRPPGRPAQAAPPETTADRARPTRRPTTRPSPRPVPTRERAKSPGGPSQVAIVIDDLGNELASSERIAAWREPVAGAVLPGLRWSAASARALAKGGKEVLLHLPMEPSGYPKVRPGPGVILRTQPDAEIVRILEEDLASVPGAIGVNNHMGSAATADPRVMRAVAGVLSGRGLFFLDSRTTDTTVAERVAEEAAVPSAHRRVFLDDVATEAAVRAQLDELVRRGRAEGGAIAIGHPYPATLAVLEAELPGLAARGVVLVKVSELVR